MGLYLRNLNFTIDENFSFTKPTEEIRLSFFVLNACATVLSVFW